MSLLASSFLALSASASLSNSIKAYFFCNGMNIGFRRLLVIDNGMNSKGNDGQFWNKWSVGEMDEN